MIAHPSTRSPPCAIIDLGHSRYLDLGMEIPALHLEE